LTQSTVSTHHIIVLSIIQNNILLTSSDHRLIIASWDMQLSVLAVASSECVWKQLRDVVAVWRRSAMIFLCRTSEDKIRPPTEGWD